MSNSVSNRSLWQSATSDRQFNFLVVVNLLVLAAAVSHFWN